MKAEGMEKTIKTDELLIIIVSSSKTARGIK